MEPIDYAGALRRSWRLVLLLALLGAVIAVLVPTGHTKKSKSLLPYSAVAVVGSPPNGSGSPLRAGVSSQQIVFYATKYSTQARAANSLGLKIPTYAYSEYMTAAVIPASGEPSAAASAGTLKRNAATLVQFTAYGKSAGAAVELANTYVYVTNAAVYSGLQTLAKNAKNYTPVTGISVQQPAIYATKTGGKKASITASRKVRGLAGLVVGAVIAAGIVLLRELLDKRLRTAARAEANFGFPVIVEIPQATVEGVLPVTGIVPVVDVIRDPDSPAAEAYRMLRMSVMFERLAPLTGPSDPFAAGFGGLPSGLPPELTEMASGPSPVLEIGERKVILVVSAGAEPTRPHVAANLAAIYAEAAQRVIVISTGDLESSSERATVGEIRPEDVRAHLEPSRLEYVSRLQLNPFVATSGQLVNRAPAILDAARTLCDVVIVEVPPLLAVHHAEALAHSVDVVLVVAECKFTTFADARGAGDLLRRISAPVLGVVLTNVHIDRSDIRQTVVFRPVETRVDEDRHSEMVPAIDAGARSGSDSQFRA